jgi:hypothetical protein
MMIIPGLALFYGGLVRVKNMLSVLTQVMAIFCLISHPVGGVRLQRWRLVMAAVGQLDDRRRCPRSSWQASPPTAPRRPSPMA